MSKDLQATVASIFAKAGIYINGNNPWDIQVHDERFFPYIIKNTSLGFGEAYMNGWWDCEKLDVCIEKIFRHGLIDQVKKNYALLFRLAKYSLKHRLFNQQSTKKVYDVGRLHYDLGNDLYQAMLDPTMSYSCGYWRTANTLAEAQYAKLKLICDKLYLKPGMEVLDIGCGWGGFAAFAAQHYQVKVTGITISQRQYEWATQHCQHLPVTIKLQDYRSLNNQFDRIVSIGMFEHVGYKNYSTYMQIAARLLRDNGLFLLHTIGSNFSTEHTDPWIDKYIFPHGMLPSIQQIGRTIEQIFVMEDWHNFGHDYSRTLQAWYDNFVRHWPQLSKQYDQRFFRMWSFYLLSCAASFRARQSQLWQLVLSKQGEPDGYLSIR